MIARAENLEPDDEPGDESGDEPRGQGGGVPPSLRPTSGQTSDTRLIARALKERWPLKPEVREALVNRQVLIALDPNSSKRESTIAFKAVLAADAMNQADEHKLQPDLHLHVGGGGVPNGETTDRILAAIVDRISAGESIDAVLGEVIDEPTG